MDSEKGNPFPLAKLPNELILHVLSFVDNKRLKEFALASRRFSQLVHTTLLDTISFGLVDYYATELDNSAARICHLRIKELLDLLEHNPQRIHKIRCLAFGPIDETRHPELYNTACDLLLRCSNLHTLVSLMTGRNNYLWHHNWWLRGLEVLHLGDQCVSSKGLARYMNLPSIKKIYFAGFESDDLENVPLQDSSVEELKIFEYRALTMSSVAFIFQRAPFLKRLEMPAIVSFAEPNSYIGSQTYTIPKLGPVMFRLSNPDIVQLLQPVKNSLQSLCLEESMHWCAYGGMPLNLTTLSCLRTITLPLVFMFGEPVGLDVSELFPRTLQTLKVVINWLAVKEFRWQDDQEETYHPLPSLPENHSWLDDLANAKSNKLPSLNRIEIEEEIPTNASFVARCVHYRDLSIFCITDQTRKNLREAGIEFRRALIME